MMMDEQSCPNDSTCVQVAAVGDGRPALLARQEILHHQDDQFGGKSGRLGAMYPAPAGEADVFRESCGKNHSNTDLVWSKENKEISSKP